MNDSLQFLNTYCQFNPNWVWIMTGISRNKDHKDVTHNVHDFLRRLVIAKPSDIEPCYNELHTIGNQLGTTYRIYISLNARDAAKTFFNFQSKMLEINLGLYQGHKDAQDLILKVGSLWKTELQQTHNRATKYFLIDVDNDTNSVPSNEITSYLIDNMVTEIISVRKTVTGSHIVIKACDTRELLTFCKSMGYEIDIQKDSMIFVEQYQGAVMYDHEGNKIQGTIPT